MNFHGSYKTTIKNALNIKNKRNLTFYKTKTFRTFATVCGCLVLITTISFAKTFSKQINNFFNANAGMDTAIQNGYISKPNMKYINSNNVETKVDNFLMDDFNLCFTLNIKLNDINVKNINDITLNNFIITDEEKRILYCNSNDTFNEYIDKENLNYRYTDFNDNYINSGVNNYIKSKNVKDNTISVVYNLYASNYPKSKNLNINFSNIICDSDEKTSLVGDWNINLKVPKKFYNRQNKIYKVKSCSDDNVKVNSAIVYDTCMKLNFTMDTEKVYNDNDSEEEIKEKLHQKGQEEYKKWNDFMKKHDWQLKTEEEYDEYKRIFELFSREDTYVQTSDGKKYYVAANTNPDDARKDDGRSTGFIEYNDIYTLTKTNATDTLTVYVQYNDNGNWKDIYIELER